MQADMSEMGAKNYEHQCNSARVDSPSERSPQESGQNLQRTNSDGIFVLSSEKQTSGTSSAVSESFKFASYDISIIALVNTVLAT